MFAAADSLLPSPPGPRILIYHRIGAGARQQMELSTGAFEWQIDWLAESMQVVPLEEALLRWEEPASRNLVVLTFDDGYRDMYTTAFPLLKERGLPATLYLTTDPIGGEDHLTWDQVAEMHSTGLITLGAHTHRHLDLRLCTADQVNDELKTSNELVERHLGEPPRHFAYPWGYWSPIAHPLVRQSYESAVLGSRPAWRAQPFDRHMIYRYPVQLSDGRRWFRARLRGGLLVEESVRRLLRGYAGP